MSHAGHLVALSAAIALHAPAASLERMEHFGAPAFRLSDGKTEAVVVPAFSGRVMRYGAVGGHNWIWNSEAAPKPGAWSNLGGDKCFIGPHGAWKLFAPRIWPPPFPSWDGAPHTAEEMPGGKLRTTGPVWNGFNAQIIREFFFSEAGELIIEQALEKHDDSAQFLSLWTVSQAAPPEAVYLPLNPRSVYANGFHTFGKVPESAAIERVSPRLLRVKPTPAKSYKLGADSPIGAIVACAGGMAWMQRATNPHGPFPDGPEGAGCPVEFYNHGEAGAGQYIELELLSPQRILKRGEKLTNVIRWSLHTVENASTQIESLLHEEPPRSPK